MELRTHTHTHTVLTHCCVRATECVSVGTGWDGGDTGGGADIMKTALVDTFVLVGDLKERGVRWPRVFPVKRL